MLYLVLTDLVLLNDLHEKIYQLNWTESDFDNT